MRKYLFTAFLALLTLSLRAQKAGETESVLDAFDDFDKEIKEMARSLPKIKDAAALEDFDKTLADWQNRWTLYCQARGETIGNNKNLLGLCSEMTAAKEKLDKDTADKRAVLQSREDYQQALQFIATKDSVYRRLLKNARRFSQIQATARQLKKIQAKEQLLTGKLDALYGAAQAACEVNPDLKIDSLENRYLELKNYSAQIQDCQYKPFIQRIKDWLVSFAAVAMLLMFFNMMQGKIQAARQMKENAKKMQEQLHKNDDEIPSI